MEVLRFAWLIALALTACHAVFDGDLGAVRCQAEGAFGPPACPAGDTCVAGICAPVGAPLGAPCAADADCRAPGWCLDPATIGVMGAPRCSRPCCASSACGPPASGQICFAPSAISGAFCWPYHEVGRVAPGAAPGGATCAAGSECRSGLCEKTCSDVCCGDASCDGDEICRLKAAASGGDLWACGLPPTAADDRVCTDDQDCRRGRCLAVEGLAEKLCAQPCCGSSSCGSIDSEGVTYLLACAAGPEGVRACARALPKSADGAVGDPCDGHDDCRSGLCLLAEALLAESEPYCSDLCCHDDSCGDLSRFVCRLGDVDGISALRCIRR